VTDANNTTVNYAYNGSNQLESVTDGNNHSTSWLYDSLGRATQKIYANGSYEKYFYDSLGQVISQRMANGTIVNFTYDNRGNVTLIDYPNMADVSYTYNNLNQVATMTDGIGTTTYGYDTMGRLTSVDGPWSNDTITYSYDSLGRRSQVSLNGNATDYDYDSLSRLSEVTNNSHVFNYSYNGASDQLNNVTLPNGTKSTFSYDSLGRLNNVQDKVVSGGANISQFTYGYDNRDVQTSVQRALGTAASQTVNYTYDDIDQLTGEVSTETTPLVNNSYTYDDAGNRLTSSIDGISSSYTLDEMNQITGYTLGGNAMNVQYDANGNTTQLGFQTMTYDDADRMTSVIQKNPLTGDNVKKVEYEYDGLSRRSESITYSWNAGNETWVQQDERRFIYDGMDLIEERDGSNNVIASYVRDGNIGGVLSRTTSSGTYFYHYDGDGNVVAMTDAAGAIVAQYTYDAYGNITSMSGSQAVDNPIRFSTKYFDSNTGYYDFGYRSYDPITGRWLNRDPIGESGGLNLYGFVGNSPGNAVDGYGLDTIYVQVPPGGLGHGSHARIGIENSNGKNMNWYGFYPYNADSTSWLKRKFYLLTGTGPGYIKWPDMPANKNWKESSNWIKINIDKDQRRDLLRSIYSSANPNSSEYHQAYKLSSYNCSTWASYMLQNLFPQLDIKNTPKSLFEALEGVEGAGSTHYVK